MARWTAFSHSATYTYDSAALTRHWPRLHAGDAEPLPSDSAVLQAWALFHAGDFQQANEAGLAAGGPGITAANKAQAIYANYLEESEKARLTMYMEVAERAEAQLATEPRNANAYYFMAYALGRYGQSISIAKALAQGLGSKVKSALETAIKLSPGHADAHIALGSFHAEVIDKVGSLVGRTQGASKDAGLAMLKTGLKLNPAAAIGMVEYAHGLMLLEGGQKMKEATKLFQDAAACTPMDATEWLDVEMAKAELND